MPDLLERYRWLIVAVFAVPLLIGIGFLLEDRFSGPEPLEIDLGEVPAEEISVYVTGAVQRPGVYPMDDGDRWIDALEDAGGATEDADLAAVDLARRAREHIDANVLSLSAEETPDEKAKEIVQTFLTTEFEGGRHLRRIEKIGEIEKE